MNNAPNRRSISAKVKKNQPVQVMNLIYNHGNPYQKLMYSDTTGPVRLEAGAKALLGQISKLPIPDRPRAVHVHWDDRMFGRNPDKKANEASAEAILSDLAQYKADGGRIVWTVHNRIAHASRDAETLHAARLRLAAMADLVHVHAAHAAAYVADECGVRTETLCIAPHPSYLGAYEPAEATLTRAEVEGPTQFLHFGYFRSNKGSDEVVRAASALSKRNAIDWRLSIVGKAFRSGIRTLRVADKLANVTTSAEAVSDEDIPNLFGGANFYVAPFRDLFTSGSIMLALTYGLPVLGPNTPAMRETTPRECHDLLYHDDDHPRRLLRAMTMAGQMNPAERKERRAICFQFAQERSPQAMSRILMRAIENVL